MSKPLSSYYEATKYLGQFVADKVKFLQDTACMDYETRRKLAILKNIMSILEKELDPETLELLKTVVIPLITDLGYAQWPRDTVTDMALKKGLDVEDVETFNLPDSSEDEDDSE